MTNQKTGPYSDLEKHIETIVNDPTKLPPQPQKVKPGQVW
jgi:hypothetical protein